MRRWLIKSGVSSNITVCTKIPKPILISELHVSTDVQIHLLGNGRFFFLLIVCYFALAPLHLLVNGRVLEVLGIARE